eukprot:m.351500 g.351500  ORF g.351500 m.351500 type:complete len:118 (-) comp20702_c0_seq4:121-474(-)
MVSLLLCRDKRDHLCSAVAISWLYSEGVAFVAWLYSEAFHVMLIRFQCISLCMVLCIQVAGSKCSLSFSREHSTADGLEHVLALNTALLQTSDIPAILQHAAKNDTPAFASLVPPTR